MSNLKLQELARQERNQYAREWRAKNKDRVRDYNARYWAKRAERTNNEASRKEKKQLEYD